MKSSLLRKIKKRLIQASFGILAISLIPANAFAEKAMNHTKGLIHKTSQHSLPLKGSVSFIDSPPEVLLPMPLGEIGESSSKVESSRNPFQNYSVLDSNNLDLLNSIIQFSGIAKSANSLVAMIKTEQGQKAYKIGDSLGNGFVVKSISSSDVTVDISNGSRNYRLSLKALNK